MKVIISGKNIELTQGIKDAVEERLSKLDKFFTEDTEAHVTLSVEKDRQKIEVTIPIKGHIVRAEQVSTDMYVSIDIVAETIERQMRKYRTKITEKNIEERTAFKEETRNAGEDEADDDIRIVRTKRFGMKPIFPEDACVQMELLGHDFYMFLNAETEEVNVVYKRKGNTYGLIEPEF